MKVSSKAVGIIAGVSALLIAAATVTANILLQDETGQSKNTNPLNRDKSYHHYSIVNKLASNDKINDLITMVKQDDSITYVIEEQKFLANIKLLVQDALKTIPAFAQKYLNYQIDCNYKINTKSILVDLVWFEPGAKNKFFDQFELILQSA